MQEGSFTYQGLDFKYLFSGDEVRHISEAWIQDKLLPEWVIESMDMIVIEELLAEAKKNLDADIEQQAVEESIEMHIERRGRGEKYTY